MLNINSFFCLAKSNFFKTFLQNKIVKLFFLGQFIRTHSIFLYTVPLTNSGIVQSANFFQRFLNSLCVFWKYAKRVLSQSQNKPKVLHLVIVLEAFKPTWRGQKTEPFSANFRPKPKKIQILNHLSIYYRAAKNLLMLLFLSGTSHI